MESLLAQLLRADTKGCDKDVGGCGAQTPIRHVLLRPPDVFTLSLSWDTNTASEADVRATLAAVATSLRPGRIYTPASYADADVRYELRALMCYYGSHYASFARTDDGDRAGYEDVVAWTRFDDAAVSAVGSWDAVCDACARGHLQPTVLFYARVYDTF